VFTSAHEILDASGIASGNATFRRITGGVSSSTVAVDLPDGGLIIKQALAQLDVAEEWTANPDRVIAEAEGLTWFNRLTPDHVPPPISVVEHLHGLILPMAPQPSPDLRTVLLQTPERWDARWATLLGTILSTWHRADYTPALGTALDDTSRLVDLRINPFYLDIARHWPEHSARIDELVDELLTIKTTVVHGDFTPKNVLCLPGGNLWVVDTEVCHIGNPVLDTASMMAHLILKGFRYRAERDTAAYLQVARHDFLDSLEPQSRPASLAAHIGLFLAVRVAGRARVSYLEESSTQDIAVMAHALLEGATLESECDKWLT
jgi:hypothetical protein